MRRFGKYVVSALITLSLGLLCSYLAGGKRFPTKHAQEIPPATVEVERTPERISSSVGHGKTSDGFETHYFEYRYSNGTYLQQYRVFYTSSDRATAELQKRLQEASEIIRQAPLFDEKGRQIGEKAIARFHSQNQSDAASVELLSTEHGTLIVKKQSSLTDLLHDFYEKR